MRILITGATGMIGTRLVPELLKRKHKLSCITRSLATARKTTFFDQVKWYEADITESDDLTGFLKNQDTVIHLAVLGHLKEGTHTEQDYKKVNVTGLENILTACRNSPVKRIIITTSTAALGFVSGDMAGDLSAANPLTPYGQSKLAADFLVQEFVKKYSLPIISLRFTHVYGPGDTRDFLKIVRWIQKGVFPQVGLAPNYYPAVYIDDAIDAIILSLTNGKNGETYMIADSDPHDTKEIRRLVRKKLFLPRIPYPVIPGTLSIKVLKMVEKAAAVSGKSLPVWSKSLLNLTASRTFSINKAEQDLGFKPRMSLNDGISNTVDWYFKEGLL